jgi:putative ABC transport system ATP-binding protein
VIEIKNLNKTYNYKKSNAFQALKNVSITIADGEMVAIMGTSGAGIPG